MFRKPEKPLATKERDSVLKDLIISSWTLITERLMAKDPVLDAATEFGRRLRDGTVTLLPKEQSDRELETIRTEQKVIRKKLDEIRSRRSP